MNKVTEHGSKEETVKTNENNQLSVETEETIGLSEKPIEKQATVSTTKTLMSWLIVLIVMVFIAAIGMWWIGSKKSAATPDAQAEAGLKEDAPAGAEHGAEVRLEPETLASAGIEMEGVTSRPAVARLVTTGSIEINPQQTQSVTPLVGGRVEQMSVKVGDYVSRNQVLAIVASPGIAQMHGKLHESETARGIAERNYERVQQAESRIAVLQAKARLDEAEATLKRTRRLIELGAGAGKDLVSAETNYKTAKADFDFQSNIALNKEIQEARAAVETARVDVKHIRDEMRALGVTLASHDGDKDHSHDTALVPVVAPAAGMVTTRSVNPGAGIEAGTTLFVLSDLSSVYAVASVPESQMSLIRIGTGAEIRSSSMAGVINARVAYIDPNLSEDTRTGRVRLEVPNPGNRLRAGMFVEIGFMTGTSTATGEELVVPSNAVQRLGEKSVVFIPVENEPGTFQAQEVELGGEVNGYTRILTGLKLGAKVVTRGSFTLKTQLQKGAMGDE